MPGNAAWSVTARRQGDIGMHLRLTSRVGYAAAIVLAVAALVGMLVAHVFMSPPKTHAAAAAATSAPLCAQRPQLCAEVAEPWAANGQYTGHDEPSLL